MNKVTSSILVAVAAASMTGGVLAHGGDIGFKIVGGSLKVGEVLDNGFGEFVQPGERVFGGEMLISDGVGDEPGFFAQAGTLGSGELISFNVRKALRVWNGMDFNTIASETMRIENPAGTAFVDTPFADPSSPIAAGWGFSFPGSGDLDDHPIYYVNGRTGPGIYLLELELTTTQAGIINSPSFWVVFNDGADDTQHDAAIDWTEENLVPAPGAAGMLAFGGLIALRRRR
ncbi:MAG: hypothetical protein HUU19_06540 [Phycisphaerales bacterium]|nr:hypothetical protein [Phycisphaerales bacterium]